MIKKFEWDKWQQDVLDTQGSITIRCGRQVGKSEVISEKVLRLARDHPGTVTMVIAATQRQASLLFEKITAKILAAGIELVEKPTMTKLVTCAGSRIYCLPAGRSGYGIRGFTVDFLVGEEAAFIAESVWTAVTPMMSVSRETRGFGWIILLSTPFGRGGYYYNTFTDKNFTSFHVSAEDCKRHSRSFLRSEKKRMSKIEYAQEYLGEFAEAYNQFFPTDLIKECMSFIEWNKESDRIRGASYYLGQDLARYGGDEVAYVIVEEHKNYLKVVKTLTRERVSTTATVGETGVLDDEWQFKRIFTDSGGLGGPVLDQLQDKLGKRKVVGLDNSSKGIQVEGEEKRTKILKEDLYSHTLMLMETGRLKMISDLSLMRSMRSMTFEYKADKKLRIFGPDSHLTEALVRACWCLKDKGLDLFIY